jgi:hypothetical protein
MGGGRGAQRPVWGGSEFKKTGARSARARTRGQNPLVINSHCVYVQGWEELERLQLKTERVEVTQREHDK